MSDVCSENEWARLLYDLTDCLHQERHTINGSDVIKAVRAVLDRHAPPPPPTR